jgi:nitrate reductase NapE component
MFGEEDNPPHERTYVADAEAEMAKVRQRGRNASVRTLLVAGVFGLLAFHWFPIPAVALIAGGICGAANTWVSMRSGERLAKTHSVGGFVISSFLRIGLFGIVPVAFARVGPVWSMACYFAGFFLPLASFAIDTQRAFRRE